MECNWKGKIAVITGGGGGIGRVIAVRLAKEGIKIVLLGGKRIALMEETSALVKKAGTECAVVSGDLTDCSLLDKLCSEIKEKYSVDILINNAGVAFNAEFEKTPISKFDEIMNINVRVPYLITQNLLPLIRKSEKGTIINISSVVGHSGYPCQSAYVASKHALLGFTKSLAAELYKEGIRVHAVSPGGVYTDMIKISRPDLSSDGMIMPEDIADIVWFLLSCRGNAVIDEISVHRINKQSFSV